MCVCVGGLYSVCVCGRGYIVCVCTTSSLYSQHYCSEQLDTSYNHWWSIVGAHLQQRVTAPAMVISRYSLYMLWVPLLES